MQIATQDWFAGAWVVRRQIDDRHTGSAGRLVGRAVFERGEAGLYYREEGLLEMNGHLLPAERRYFWRFEPEGRIRIFFDDGSPFHSFVPGRPVSDHLCGDDRYAVEYGFDDDGWRSRWEVLGPAKEYVMETWYSRVNDAGGDAAG